MNDHADADEPIPPEEPIEAAEVLEPDEVDGRARPGPPTGGVSWRTIAGAAAVVLTLNGLLLLSAYVPPLADPDAARCTLSRNQIELTLDDDVAWNDVDLGATAVDDLDCAEAESIATSIPTSEDGDATYSLPSTGAIRTTATVAIAIGLAQIAGGVLLLRSARRRVRNLAAIAAAAGTIVPIFGLASLVVAFFVVFALVFSRQSRVLWPR